MAISSYSVLPAHRMVKLSRLSITMRIGLVYLRLPFEDDVFTVEFSHLLAQFGLQS